MISDPTRQAGATNEVIPNLEEARRAVRDYELGDEPDIWLINRLYLLWTIGPDHQMKK